MILHALWSRPIQVLVWPIRSLMGVGLLVLSVLGAQPAEAAGQNPPPDTLAADTIRPIPLPPLQVRILRAPMGLDEVPHSVSVVGGRELFGGRAGASLEETLQALPGLQIQNRFNFSTGERIILRGIGARTQFGVRGVRILIDGIPATLPDGQSTLDQLDLFSLGSVEVLRGPGATLYGNGAGGVIRFSSRPVSNARGRPEALLMTGSHGLFRASALLSGQTAGFDYLFSLGRFTFDGFRFDPVRGSGSYGEAERWNGNGRLTRWVAGGRMALTVTLLTQDSENPGSLSGAQLKENPTQAYRFNVLQRTGEEVEQGTVGLSWQRDWRGQTFELGAHGVRRELWSPIPPAIIDLSREAGGLRVEVRGQRELPGLGGERLSIVWSAGMEGEGQWDHRRNLENDGGQEGELTLDQDETVTARSLFLNTSLEAGPKITVMGGARYDRIRFGAEDYLVTGDNPDDSGSRVLDALSPSMGVRVSPFDWLTLRANASTFFQTPTTSEFSNQATGAGGLNPDLDPQRGRSLELGVKLGNRRTGQMEATLFRTRIRDELVPFEVPESPGRVFFRNAGESAHEGAELATSVTLPGGLRFRAAYTFTDSRFQDFVLDGEDLKGNLIPGVARHRLDGVVHWEAPARDGVPGLFLEVRGLYQGRVPVNDQNTEAASPYALWDVRGGIEEISVVGAAWTLFGGVTNLLDRSYISSVSVNAFGGRYFEPGPGRSLYIGIRTSQTFSGSTP